MRVTLRPRGARRVALLVCLATASVAAQAQSAVPNLMMPATQADALDGRHINLPKDAPGGVTVIILGFGRKSADATTAWEKPVRTALANAGAPGSSTAAAPRSVGFLDMAMLAEVPGFMRSIVTRAIRGKVPDVLKPNFVVLTSDEDAWKHVAGYEAQAPDAAYVMLFDRGGHLRWSTHAAFNEARFSELVQQTQRLLQEQH